MKNRSLNAFRLYSYEEYQFWLARNEDILEELEELIGTDLGVDIESLDTLESFLLRRYRTLDEGLRIDARSVIDAAARQIGLIMLLNVDGAKWAINLKDEDMAYYSLPIIQFPDSHEVCPLAMATASLDRRTGNFLRTVVKKLVKDYNVETNE